MTPQSDATPLPSEPHRRPGRDAGQIERDIEASRRRLAVTVDELTDRVNPGNVTSRLKDRARDLVIDENGSLRLNRLAPIAGVVVGIVVLRVARARAARPKTPSERLTRALTSGTEAARDALTAGSEAGKERLHDLSEAVAATSDAAKDTAKDTVDAAKKRWSRH